MAETKSITRHGWLHLDIRDLWHAGSGRGSGRYLDAVVVTDTTGLPYLPGRQLRGVLRDALSTLQDWGHTAAGTVERLFGHEAEVQSDALRYRKSHPGCLAIGNAQLDEPERLWLVSDENVSLRKHLFMEVFSTAIDSRTGVAADASLRGIQVAVPVQLIAPVALESSSVEIATADWQALQLAARAVRHIGAHRSRGYGRVLLTLREGGRA